jgi:monovalent cation:H+ antiporter, CPA1 family
VLEPLALLIALTALFAWLNERTLRLPTTVGVTLAGAAASLLLIALDSAGLPGLRGWAERFITELNFTEFVLGGILSALLFAGALGLDTKEVLRQKRPILILAFASTLISTLLIGSASYLIFQALGLNLPLWWAFLFGALISPTDPVAVLDLLKRARVSKRLQTLIAGESLFNDGVGIVVFLVVAALAGVGPHPIDPSIGNALLLFGQEAIGGVLMGLLLGYLGYYFTKTIDGHSTEVLITLAVVIGGYGLAAILKVSGPLSMVVAGLVISRYKEDCFDAKTRELVEGFWEVLDELLNIVLFTLIGLNVVLAEANPALILASLAMVLIALVARFLSVGTPLWLLGLRAGYGAWTTRLLTWAGLRGGIAIGLALGLPDGRERELILAPTFAVVLFTIVVQGLTVMPLVRRALANG